MIYYSADYDPEQFGSLGFKRAEIAISARNLDVMYELSGPMCMLKSHKFRINDDTIKLMTDDRGIESVGIQNICRLNKVSLLLETYFTGKPIERVLRNKLSGTVVQMFQSQIYKKN